MDPVNLLQAIYQNYREKRLADVLALLSEEFKLTVSLPDDLPSEQLRARSKAETALLVHSFLDQYDVLVFEPGEIEVAGEMVTARPTVEFRHKKSGRILQTQFTHTWHIADGRATRLHQNHDADKLRAYSKACSADGHKQSV